MVYASVVFVDELKQGLSIPSALGPSLFSGNTEARKISALPCS